MVPAGGIVLRKLNDPLGMLIPGGCSASEARICQTKNIITHPRVHFYGVSGIPRRDEFLDLSYLATSLKTSPKKLRKLGIAVAKSTVEKYRVHPRNPSSPS